jgi:hypothetical protein
MEAKSTRVGLLAVLVIALSWQGNATAATAGVFQFVAGDVRIVSAPGQERAARKGALLNVGEEIATAEAATAQIKMGDGAIVVVQPRSRLTVTTFNFSGGEDGSERVVFRLEQGGFRSVTGAIGHTHKNSYLIETPVAQMGVRGTDHESYYFAPGSGNENPGAYNKVNTGLTFIRTPAGEVLIAPNQVGYVRGPQDVPGLLPSIPGFFNRAVAPRNAQFRSPEQGPARPPVVQKVKTDEGIDLSDSNPLGSLSAVPPLVPPANASGGGSAAGYSDASFARSALNPVIAANGATIGNAGGDAAFGVDWGSWQGGAPTVNGSATSGSVHFINAASLTTATQLGALSAAGVSATYSYLGGPAPTGGSGAQGTINSLSVGVNFGTQAITNYAVNATVGAQTWNASGSGSIAQFTASSGIALSGSCAGCVPGQGAPTANGTANGAFVGPAAERLITSFGLKAANQTVSGAAYLGR